MSACEAGRGQAGGRPWASSRHCRPGIAGVKAPVRRCAHASPPGVVAASSVADGQTVSLPGVLRHHPAFFTPASPCPAHSCPPSQVAGARHAVGADHPRRAVLHLLGSFPRVSAVVLFLSSNGTDWYYHSARLPQLPLLDWRFERLAAASMAPPACAQLRSCAGALALCPPAHTSQGSVPIPGCLLSFLQVLGGVQRLGPKGWLAQPRSQSTAAAAFLLLLPHRALHQCFESDHPMTLHRRPLISLLTLRSTTWPDPSPTSSAWPSGSPRCPPSAAACTRCDAHAQHPQSRQLCIAAAARMQSAGVCAGRRGRAVRVPAAELAHHTCSPSPLHPPP